MDTNSRLKVAIIGCGMIANTAHIPAYLNLGKRVHLCAVSDLRADSARETAERFSIPRWYTEAEDMLVKEKPDLVSVCTSNASHKAMAMLAMRHGAHVACEKPVALNYDDTRELYAYARKHGLVLFACQVLRYNTEYQLAHEWAHEGRLGDIYFSESVLIRRRGIPKWGAFHKKETNGGGVFCDLGVHLVDAALWVMGGPKFTSVSGVTSSIIARSGEKILTSVPESGAPAGVPNMPPYSASAFDVDEFAAGMIRLDNGASIHFKTSWVINLPNEYGMTFAGSLGGLVLPEMTLLTTMGRYQADVRPRVFSEERPYANEVFPGHFFLMENAVDHLQKATPLMVQPEETLNVTAIIDGFYRSAELGREVFADEIVGK